MASSLVPSNSAFYYTPVTKGLMGYLVVSTCAIHAPALAHLRSSILYNFNDTMVNGNLFRLLASKLICLDIKDLICSCLLFYYFRVFERRLGSRKYFSLLVQHLFTSSAFEIGVIYAIRSYTGVTINFLPSGPIAVLFSLFVSFFFDIPSSNHVYMLGVPVSGKAFTYFLGLQLITGSRGALVSSIGGILSGLINRCLPIVTWVPKPVASFFSSLFKWFESDPPDDGPILLGATLEIQREQQMELLEQQMMLNSMEEAMRTTRQFNFQRSPGDNARNPTVPPPAPFSLPPDAAGPSTAQHSSNAHANGLPPQVQVNEDNIRALVEMGFEREQVIQALRRSNNDITAATGILLSDS